MRKGEKGILFTILIIVIAFSLMNSYRKGQDTSLDKGIPFYSIASEAVQEKGNELVRQLKCRDCHTLWGVRNAMQSVPSPALDGIGSLRDEAWLLAYLSAEDPQQILPSRLKAEYQMPSFAYLTAEERNLLAEYLAGLRVEDWYLEDVKKVEYEKLTGKDYQGSVENE